MRIRTLIALLPLLALPAHGFGGAQITHHTIRAEVDPGRSRITVTDQFTLEGYETSEVRFLLHKGLKISALSKDGRSLRWSESEPKHDDGGEGEETGSGTEEMSREVTVNLSAGDGEPVELVIEYAGVVLDSLRAPKEAYARSFAQTNGLIEERGAFLAGATHWLPTIPGDLFTFRMETEVPRDWESVSQGALEARFIEGGGRISRWVSREPMEEVYLVAGPYVFREEEYKDMKVQTFLYEADDGEELHEKYVGATIGYIDRYSHEIGDYPFPKFALVENFWQTGFGMPSFTLLGTQVIRLPFILYTSYGHEILHNWWGNGVFVDWEKGNWCEGLTAYGADYAYKEDRGSGPAISYRRGSLQKFKDYVSVSEDFPLIDFRSRSDASTQAVGYSKATMLFHMLRNEIGDAAFREGKRILFRDRCFKVSGWGDLRAAFEEASGEKLEDFFRQWTERSGAPSLSLADVEAKGKWGGGFSVEGTIRQETPPFRVDVPVRIETEAGVESLVVYMKGEEKSFEWKGDSRPLSVAVDPDFDIFRELNREEIPAALSQTLGADSVLIVLPPEGAYADDAALLALADQWAAAPGAIVTREEVDDEVLNGRFVWLIGPTVYNDRMIDALPGGAGRSDTAWRVPDGEFDAATHSVVLTTRHPGNGDLAWSLFYPVNGEVIPSLGRKIPHYGRYGYLVFEGTDNVAKGEWASGESPLKVPLEVE